MNTAYTEETYALSKCDSYLSELKSNPFKIPKEVYRKLQHSFSDYNVKVVVSNRCTKCDCNMHRDRCDSYCTKEDISTCYVYARNINKYTQRKLRLNTKFKPQKSSTSIRLIRFKASSNSHYFSRSQVLQLLMYYHFADSNGQVSMLSKRKLANIIGCSLTTIDRNNVLFEKHGICMARRDCRGYLFVKISNYKDQFAKGGNGYLEIPNAFIESICTNKELRGDKLRLYLGALLNYDFDSVIGRKTTLKRSTTKNILTRSRTSRYSLAKLADSINNVLKGLVQFTLQYNKEFKVKINPILNGKLVKDELTKKYTKQIIDLTETINIFDMCAKDIELLDSDISVTALSKSKKHKLIVADLVQLSKEYSFKLVEKALIDMINEPKGTIKNIGGYIRSTIKDYLNQYKYRTV